jgi:hypothetical protein
MFIQDPNLFHPGDPQTLFDPICSLIRALWPGCKLGLQGDQRCDHQLLWHQRTQVQIHKLKLLVGTFEGKAELRFWECSAIIVNLIIAKNTYLVTGEGITLFFFYTNGQEKSTVAPPRSESVNQRYGYGSGSFYHQAKIVRRTLIPTVLWLLYDFLTLKYDVNVPLKNNKQKNLAKKKFFVVGLKVSDENSRICGPRSGSVTKCHGSATEEKRLIPYIFTVG